MSGLSALRPLYYYAVVFRLRPSVKYIQPCLKLVRVCKPASSLTDLRLRMSQIV